MSDFLVNLVSRAAGVPSPERPAAAMPPARTAPPAADVAGAEGKHNSDLTPPAQEESREPPARLAPAPAPPPEARASERPRSRSNDEPQPGAEPAQSRSETDARPSPVAAGRDSDEPSRSPRRENTGGRPIDIEPAVRIDRMSRPERPVPVVHASAPIHRHNSETPRPDVLVPALRRAMTPGVTDTPSPRESPRDLAPLAEMRPVLEPRQDVAAFATTEPRLRQAPDAHAVNRPAPAPRGTSPQDKEAAEHDADGYAIDISIGAIELKENQAARAPATPRERPRTFDRYLHIRSYAPHGRW
jgi:hypothetical protein